MTAQSQDTTPTKERTVPRHADRTETPTTADRVKQALVAVLGGALLVRGLRRRSLRGLATAALGGWLLSRAVGGSSRATERLPSRTSDDSGVPGGTEEMAVTRSITVGKSAEECYEAWRDPDTLSEVMGHFADVTASNDDRLRWTVDGPRNRDISWETRIVEDDPGQIIRWQTPSDAIVYNEGSVRFREATGDRGTVVTLSVDFEPPGGTLGTVTLQQFGVVPDTLAGEALQRFKSLVETGEIQTLEGNPSGRGEGDLL